MTSHQRSVAAYRERHSKLGLCQDCSRPAVPGKTLCSVHLERHIKWATQALRFRRENNRCTRCATPLNPDVDFGYVTCINCREKLHFMEGIPCG